MKSSGVRNVLFAGRRKWATVGVLGLLLLLGIGWAAFGERMRFERILAGIEKDPDGTLRRLRALGRPARGRLKDAAVSGTRTVGARVLLFQFAAAEPFYLSRELRSALSDGNPDVRIAAAIFYLGADRQIGQPTQPLPDDVWAAIESLVRPEETGRAGLGWAIEGLEVYRDPRIPGALAPFLDAPSTGRDLVELGRANDARRSAANVLAAYLDDPRAVRALKTVATRPESEDSSVVQSHAWKALAAGGWADDPDLYLVAARSPSDLTRQMVAENLERVKDPRVAPILHELAFDRRDIVRSGAVSSLQKRRDPFLLERLEDLAEDTYSNVRADLADAVRYLRAMDRIPYLGRCLYDTDPYVVERAVGALSVLTGQSWVFTEAQWREFQQSGLGRRMEMVGEFMNDEARKEKAVAALAAAHPPRYTDEARIPHLVVALRHPDPEVVKRAMRELVRITGRSEGFDPALLDPAADVDAEANAMHRYLNEPGLRDGIVADWERWVGNR